MYQSKHKLLRIHSNKTSVLFYYCCTPRQTHSSHINILLDTQTHWLVSYTFFMLKRTDYTSDREWVCMYLIIEVDQSIDDGEDLRREGGGERQTPRGKHQI